MVIIILILFKTSYSSAVSEEVPREGLVVKQSPSDQLTESIEEAV